MNKAGISSAQDRRALEQIQTLFGDRGNPADRALRVGDLTNLQSPLLAPLLDIITARSKQVVQGEVITSTGTIRRQVQAGRQLAQAAALQSERTQTKLNQLNQEIDAALDGLSDEFLVFSQNFTASLNRSTPPVDFVSGDINWTSTASGSPEAVGAPHASWVFDSDLASQAVPSATSGALLATKGVVSVTEADTIRITVIARVTGSGAGLDGMGFVFTWLDAAFSTSTLVASVDAVDLAPGGWVTITASAPAPPDAFWVRGGISIDGTAYTAGAALDVSTIKVENLMSLTEIEAGISINFYTKAAADQAIAAGIETYDASVEGGLSANVTLTSVAMADLNGSVARFSALVSTGGGFNAAGIEVLAWDDETGASGSAVRLLGDEVIVEGSLSAQSLVITDGSGELLPNWNFFLGDLRGWTQEIGTAAVVLEKVAGIPGLETANAKYSVSIPAAGVMHRLTTTSKMAAEAGQRFAFGFEAASGGTTTGATALMRLRFFDLDDVLISGAVVSGDVNSATWVTFANVAAAPAGTVSMEVRLELTPAADVPIYATNLSLLRQRSGAILITPNSITGAELITTEALITNSAQIADLTLVNAHISGNIESDNYAEDGSGNPTAGFQLKRDTGTIKGVEFIDGQGLAPGATRVTHAASAMGELSRATYAGDNVWTEVLAVEFGPVTEGQPWVVTASGEQRNLDHSEDNPSPPPEFLTYTESAHMRLMRQIKKTSGDGWSTPLEVAVEASGSTSDTSWRFRNFFEGFCGELYAVRYSLEVKQDILDLGGTPPTLYNLHRDLQINVVTWR